jgi:branched-chain amino acid transport system permease protein
MMFWTASLEVMVMCLLGGWYIFLGPLFGAAVILGFRTFVGIYTEHWPLILGIILMAVILWLPEGVLGFIVRPATFKTEFSAETEPKTDAAR